MFQLSLYLHCFNDPILVLRKCLLYPNIFKLSKDIIYFINVFLRRKEKERDHSLRNILLPIHKSNG